MIIRVQQQKLSPILITETYRTYERSDYLYEQGRSRPGNIVSNAVGGFSIHNFRMAFDFARNVKGKEWDNTDGFFNQVGAIWRAMGGVWGGDWPGFIDLPHCEWTNGHTTGWFRNGNNVSVNVKMPWEIQG